MRTTFNCRRCGWEFRRQYVPAAALVDARSEIKLLREALFIAQGEAYLGTLAGDDTPDPLAACHNVISACLEVV